MAWSRCLQRPLVPHFVFRVLITCLHGAFSSEDYPQEAPSYRWTSRESGQQTNA